jgi:hypothetical protein
VDELLCDASRSSPKETRALGQACCWPCHEFDAIPGYGTLLIRDGHMKTASEEKLLAESYRIRAQQLRALAEMDDQLQTREMLLKVAVDYDRVADRLDAEQRVKVN